MDYFDAQLFANIASDLRINYESLVETAELSRMPTDEEMSLALGEVRRRMTAGEWGDSTQELAQCLCAVAPGITTTLTV